MKTQTQKLPSAALMLIGEEAPKVSFLKGDGDTKKARLNMMAYSGGVIKNHWWWDDLAIDLEGMKFTEKKYPILEDHRTDKKIAFTGKPQTDQGKVTIDPDNTEFVSTEESEKFQRLSAEGFPFQSSIRVRPKVIERVAENASVKVNGFTLKGPGTVFRQCEFVEASVCVFGYDSKTSAKAFAKDGGEEEITFTERLVEAPKEEKEIMDKETLKKEHPDLLAQIEEDARTAFQAEHDKEKNALSAQISTLEGTVTDQGKKILAFEKAETLRAERERAAAADRIWDAQLSASKVPAHLHGKVRKHVAYTQFMKEGGIFDSAAFTEAVNAEIGEWETAGVSNDVIGASFIDKEAADAAASLAKEKVKEEDELVNSLLSFTNIETD